MKDIIRVDSNMPDDYLRIELFLSNVCNYKCWYCYPGSNEGTHLWPDLNLVIENLSCLINHYQTTHNKKKFGIEIIGGEPTLWRELGNFIKYFKETYDCIIIFSTNASRTLRWWEEFGSYVDQVIISCHHERADVAHLISVADLLYQKNVNLTAMVLMDPREWDKCVSIVTTLSNSTYNWPVLVSEVIHNTVTYTQEQLEYFDQPLKREPNLEYVVSTKKHLYILPTITFADGSTIDAEHNWLSVNRLNHFYGWSCNVGVDTLFIDTSGNITGACGKSLYNSNYSIFDLEFKSKFAPTIAPVVCDKIECTCQPEINASKYKIIPIQAI